MGAREAPCLSEYGVDEELGDEVAHLIHMGWQHASDVAMLEKVGRGV